MVISGLPGRRRLGCLDDTLRAHARLAYRGPLTVLLVYHKEPAADPAAQSGLEEAESELRAAWAGREEGNVRWVDSEQQTCLQCCSTLHPHARTPQRGAYSPVCGSAASRLTKRIYRRNC